MRTRELLMPWRRRGARRSDGRGDPASLGEGFMTLYERAPLGIAMLSPTGRFLKANAALCGILGYSEPELRARGFSDVTYPEDVADCQRLFDEVERGRLDHFTLEKRHVRKDGAVIWTQVV